MSLERASQLKKKLENLQRQFDRAQGNLDRLNEQLKEDFDCSSLAEAEDYLAELEKERKQAKRKHRKALEAFEGKWGEFLES